MLCDDREAGETPRLVHLKRLETFASVHGNVCPSDFDFLEKNNGGKGVSWPALELFKIQMTVAIVDHPRATGPGEETVESLHAKSEC